MRPFDQLSRRHLVPLAAFIGSAALAGAGLTLATNDGGDGDTLPPLRSAAISAPARSTTSSSARYQPGDHAAPPSPPP